MRRAVQRSAPGRKSLPIYAQITADLKRRIASGKYPVGSTLPKEAELAIMFGVSKHTIRESMRQLASDGLVLRRKRAGTKVKATSKPIIYRQPVNTVKDLLQFAEGSKATLLSKTTVKCDRKLATLLESSPGQEWVCVQTIRAYPTDPRPLCLTTNYLNRELLGVEEVVGEDLSAPISALLETRYRLRIVRIQQSIQAELLKGRDAKILKAAPKSAGLRAVRRYYDENGRLVELSIAIHAGERFIYVMQLDRE